MTKLVCQIEACNFPLFPGLMHVQMGEEDFYFEGEEGCYYWYQSSNDAS
jgi:hypothetical protein